MSSTSRVRREVSPLVIDGNIVAAAAFGSLAERSASPTTWPSSWVTTPATSTPTTQAGSAGSQLENNTSWSLSSMSASTIRPLSFTNVTVVSPTKPRLCSHASTGSSTGPARNTMMFSLSALSLPAAQSKPIWRVCVGAPTSSVKSLEGAAFHASTAPTRTSATTAPSTPSSAPLPAWWTTTARVFHANDGPVSPTREHTKARASVPWVAAATNTRSKPTRMASR
jgi:hypothetical protein